MKDGVEDRAQADMFSLGMTTYAMALGAPQLDSVTAFITNLQPPPLPCHMTPLASALPPLHPGVSLEPDEFRQVKECGELLNSSHLPPELDALIGSMITLEPHKRPAASEVYQQCVAMRARHAQGYYKMFFKDFKESA